MNPKAWVEAVLELIWRIGLRALIWVGLGYFLFRVRSVVIAILLAAVLTYAVLPIVDFLCSRQIRGLNRRLQRLLATTLVFVFMISLTVILSAAFFSPLQAELAIMTSRVDTYAVQLKDMASSAQRWYIALPPDVQKFLETQDFQNIGHTLTKWSQTLLRTTVDILSHIFGVILIPVLAFYFTLDSRTLKREFVALVPRSRAREALSILHEINCIMRSYVIGQIILCAIAGLVVGLMLRAFDMQYVLILSVFAGITRAVPVIGPIVSGAAIVLFGLIKAPLVGFYLLILFAFMHFAESKFIMPKLIGHRMQLHPAMVIIVLLIGAEFFGILGMFMAAPVAAILRVLIRYYLIKPKHLRVWGMSRQGRAGDIPESIEADELVATHE